MKAEIILPPERIDAELSLLLSVIKNRTDTANNVASQEFITKVLSQDQLTEYKPKQSVYGLEKCSDALSRIRKTLFIRTITQDHHINKAQIVEDCEEIFEVISAENPITIPQELPRVDFNKITPSEFYNSYVKQPHAVVIENFGHTSEKFHLASLAERYGDQLVPLIMIDTAKHYEGPFSDLLKGETYLANSDGLLVSHPELLQELNFEALAGYTKLKQLSAQLFVSNKGAGSPSHCGRNGNTFYQLEGEKKWSLVDPAFLYLLYPVLLPGDALSALYWQDETDYKRCPLFSYCPRYEVTLSPGDILWNPFCWYHSVKNLTKSSVAVAVRWWTGTPGADFQNPVTLYELARTLAPRGIELDTVVGWILERGREFDEKLALYDIISHGRFYSFDHSYNAAAWGVKPAKIGSAFDYEAVYAK